MAAEDFLKCPKGHSLPHRGPTGECSPLRCAGADKAVDTHAARQARYMARKKVADVEARGGEELIKAEDAEEKKIKLAARKHEKWMQFLGAPTDLAADKVEEYADKKLVSLLPAAVAVLEQHVKYGTEEQRERAANKILDANGRGKREAVAASTPPIVINISGGGGLPWLKSETVQGEVVAPAVLPKVPDSK